MLQAQRQRQPFAGNCGGHVVAKCGQSQDPKASAQSLALVLFRPQLPPFYVLPQCLANEMAEVQVIPAQEASQPVPPTGLLWPAWMRRSPYGQPALPQLCPFGQAHPGKQGFPQLLPRTDGVRPLQMRYFRPQRR